MDDLGDATEQPFSFFNICVCMHARVRVRVCVRVHACACVCVRVCVGQKRALNPLDLELQAILSSAMWMLGTGLGFCKNSTALNCQAVLPHEQSFSSSFFV